MKSSEFVRRARNYARRNGLEFQYDSRRGKGSHGRILMGSRLTAIKSGNKAIGTGLFHKMLKDLGIEVEEF